MDANNIFLTSTVSFVAHDIPKYLAKSSKGLKLVFIFTAAETEKGDLDWLENDRDALIKAGFAVSDFTITGKSKREIGERLKETDVIYFSGGNQFYLLRQIQLSKAKETICNLVKEGKIYIGSSAGSIVAGPDIYATRFIDESSKAESLKSYEGLGLVDFTIFPHWGSDEFKELYLKQRLENAYCLKHKIILLTDHQYVRVKNGWYKIEEVK